MTKEQVKKEHERPEGMRDAVEEANAKAGYDVALAYAALYAAAIDVQGMYDFELFKSKADIAAMFDMVVRGNGCKIDANCISNLVEIAVAYGWYWGHHGESFLRSEKVQKELTEFVDAKPGLTIKEKADRKEGLEKGFAAIGDAVKRAMERLQYERLKKGGVR